MGGLPAAGMLGGAQPPWSPDMLADLYMNWSSMAQLSVAAAAAAEANDAGSGGPSPVAPSGAGSVPVAPMPARSAGGGKATAGDGVGDWRSVAQAAAASASALEIQKMAASRAMATFSAGARVQAFPALLLLHARPLGHHVRRASDCVSGRDCLTW
jgi:hypothetical protein